MMPLSIFIIKMTTDTIKIKSLNYNKRRPTSLITTDDVEYTFPNFIFFSNYDCNRLDMMLRKSNVNIVYDRLNRIQKVENFPFIWDEKDIYTLKVLSFSKGLIFNEKVKITAYENIELFFSSNYKIIVEKLEIIVIIKKTMNNIPLVY